MTEHETVTTRGPMGAPQGARGPDTTTRDRVEGGERLLSLSEAADVLKMKRPNVAKFLARRGIKPAVPKAQGYFWWAADIERAKREREADKARMAADAQRRESALHGRRREPSPPPELARLGRAQREVLSELLRHPIPRPQDARRFALLRLAKRGLAEELTGEAGSVFALTEQGRALAGHL